MTTQSARTEIETIVNRAKVQRSAKREQAGKLRASAKELDDQCYGMTEVIDSLEALLHRMNHDKPLGPTGPVERPQVRTQREREGNPFDRDPPDHANREHGGYLAEG